MMIQGPAVMHKEAILMWGLGKQCFFPPQFVMSLFGAKLTFEWDMAPVDLGEWKVWMQRFFPAIFQLEESCVLNAAD